MRDDREGRATGRGDAAERIVKLTRRSARRAVACYLAGRPAELASLAAGLRFLAGSIVDDQPAIVRQLQDAANDVEEAAGVLGRLESELNAEEGR